VSAAGIGAPERLSSPRKEEPTPAERAVVRTVAYAALFQAPIRLEDLQRALMDVALGKDELMTCLQRPYVRQRVTVTEDGFVHMRGQEACLVLNAIRREHTRRLMERHAGAMRAVAAFPFVRLAGVSGACAHENATDEDVDVFLVAREGRAWFTYLGLVLLSRWLGVRRTLCLNYVLDETALALRERDRFTASEMVSMRPRAGRDTYRRFLGANAWAAERYPNFFAGQGREAEAQPEVGGPPWLERLLDLGPAPLLELLSRRLLGWHLRRKAHGRPGVVLSPSCLKLHTQDHAPHLNSAYDQRLFELENPEEEP